ncbi:MAG: sugar transferase [candidate division Zixibacteria bacterium]|nr:sugar transferase [candidate division Zixibacteria bacterium]
MNIFDNPYRDNIHNKPTPVLGGIAICLSIFIVIMIARFTGIYEWHKLDSGLFVGGALIALVGFVDDRFGMNPVIKLVGQFISAGMFIVFIESTMGIFHPLIEFGGLIFFLVVMMNAFNILDNMDGVTGSMSFAAGLAFLAVAILSHDKNLALTTAALIGAVLGFLKFNLPRAKIFMGDSGAMFLGFIMGAFAIIYMTNNKSYYLMTTPFLILSYPIFDIALVSLSRMREKRNLSVAAPDSSPYRLARWIFSTKNAYIAVFLINLVMGLFGVITYVLKDNQMSVLLIFIAGLSLSVLGVHLYRNFLHFIERTVFFVIDIISINLSFYLLYSLKYSWGIFSYEAYIPYKEMFAPAIWISLFWILLFSVMGIYEIRPERHFSEYTLALLKVIGLGMAGFILLVVFLEGNFAVSILPVILYVFIFFVLNCVFRYPSFLIVRWLSNRPSHRPRAAILIRNINANLNELMDLAKQRFSVIGYICAKHLGDDYYNLNYLGDENTLSNTIRKERLEKIVLVWPEDDYSDFMPIFQSYFFLENQFLLMGEPPDPFKGFKKIKLYRRGFIMPLKEILRTWEWMVKRGLDIFASSLILTLSSPVFLFHFLIAKLKNQPFLVKVSFYGRDGNMKYCYDFYKHASKYSGYDRIKLNMPALISVFEGSLSLVGTLPLSQARAAKDSMKFPGFWRRKLVKPGIFSMANNCNEDEYFEKELKYMQKMSILLDVWLIFVGITQYLINLVRKKDNVGYEVY